MEYIPARGDIVWMDFDPQKGHEQAGHRPALVLSALQYNRRGLMLVCPITTKHKNNALATPVISGKINGFVLADHIKNQDWRQRGASFAGKASDIVMESVLRIVALLLIDD